MGGPCGHLLISSQPSPSDGVSGRTAAVSLGHLPLARLPGLQASPVGLSSHCSKSRGLLLGAGGVWEHTAPGSTKSLPVQPAQRSWELSSAVSCAGGPCRWVTPRNSCLFEQHLIRTCILGPLQVSWGKIVAEAGTRKRMCSKLATGTWCEALELWCQTDLGFSPDTGAFQLRCFGQDAESF